MSLRQDRIVTQYEKHPRFLSPQFIDSIPWHDVKKYPLDEKFFPVIVYMRDIEAFTDIYYQQLAGTPTGRDPIIRRFMDKWLSEEVTHAELLNRFLEEAGFSTSEKWLEIARSKIPPHTHTKRRITTMLTNLFGQKFTAVHMTWGAINELSTLQGYKRLWEMAKHPVLEYILRGIAHEEASHIFFYRSIAKLKLYESPFARELARFVIDRFWQPVGVGIKTREESNYVIRTLFADEPSLGVVDTDINGSITNLPGFEDVHRVSRVIRRISTSS